MRVAKKQLAYCTPAIRILQVVLSHSFNFLSQCFFTPSRRCCRADSLEYLTDENLLKESSIIFLFDKKLWHVFYISIIITERIVTIWMNILNAFSGKSLTKRMPRKAPMPITGSIMRFSENELHVMLSHAKIWKGTFRRFTTRKNQALMPMYSIFSLRMESR